MKLIKISYVKDNKCMLFEYENGNVIEADLFSAKIMLGVLAGDDDKYHKNYYREID